MVTSPWLNGVSRDSAIRLEADGVVRWQGRRSGEQAELIPNGYRWVGPDGSMLSCTTSVRPRLPKTPATDDNLRCVAIDTDGDTAVTTAAKGPRVVYGPDGRWLGTFDVNGNRLSSAAPALTVERQIADSGVDVPALVNFATRRMPFAGGATGDPHFITAGGQRVSSQRIGDFHARFGDAEHQVQVRMQTVPFQPDASFVTMVAVGVPKHRIQIDLNGQLTVDGAPIRPTGAFRQLSLADGPDVGVWPPDVDGAVDAEVLWPDGSTIAVNADPALGLTVIASLPSTSPAAGVFGSSGPGAEGLGDLLPRPGATAGSADQAVESWRVRAGESLFNSVPDAPAPAGPPLPVSPAATLAAQKYCSVAGIGTAADFAACIFDVARTGDDGYVVHHVHLAQAATRHAFPAELADQWPALIMNPELPSRAYELGDSIDETVAAGESRALRLDLSVSTRLTIKGSPCQGGGESRVEAARGEAALRLFGSARQAVGDRRPWCGTSHTDLLSAGTYFLVLAGPQSGVMPSSRLTVTTD